MDTVASLRGYETLPRNDYATVMNHLATVGPLSVAGKQKAEINVYIIGWFKKKIIKKNIVPIQIWQLFCILTVDASRWSSYGGGVFEGCSYSSNIEINHGKLLLLSKLLL